MILRRFNEQGIESFVTYRNGLLTAPDTPPPFDFLENSAFSEKITPETNIDKNRKFETRLDAGKYLYDIIIKQARIPNPEKDRGLWTWLTLLYFDQLCPPDPNGNRNPMHEARLIFSPDNFRRFYRHLLVGPFLAVRAHPDNPERAIAFLSNQLHQPGDIAEQLASRQEVVTNPNILDLASKLYYDENKKTFKPSATSKMKGGTARRFVKVLNQLDLTWYLYGISADDLEKLLPREFDRFRGNA
jgi:hypothetical protein